MTDQFTELLSAIKNIDRRLTRIETYNQVRTIKDADGNTIIDSQGLVSSSSFTNTDTANLFLNQIITSTSFTDITGSTLTITVSRPTLVLMLVTTDAYLTESIGNTANALVGLNIDGGVPYARQAFNSGENQLTTRTSYELRVLTAGTHTVKLQAKLSIIFAGSPSMTLYSFKWSYLILGT